MTRSECRRVTWSCSRNFGSCSPWNQSLNSREPVPEHGDLRAGEVVGLGRPAERDGVTFQRRWREAWISVHDDGSVTLAAALGGHRKSDGTSTGDAGRRLLRGGCRPWLGACGLLPHT